MAKTPDQKAAEKAARDTAKAAEETRRAALTPEQRAAEDAANAKAKEPVTTPVTVSYLDHEGNTVTRVFSPDVHGADFVKFAEEFKKTNAARIVPAAPAADTTAPAA